MDIVNRSCWRMAQLWIMQKDVERCERAGSDIVTREKELQKAAENGMSERSVDVSKRHLAKHVNVDNVDDYGETAL